MRKNGHYRASCGQREVNGERRGFLPLPTCFHLDGNALDALF